MSAGGGGCCKCGADADCKCGERYSEFSYLEESTTRSIILGIGPEKMFDEESEMSFQGESGRCKFRSCDPCCCQ